MESLIAWDLELFRRINSQWISVFFDAVLPFIRQAYFWVPVYVFILAYVAARWGRRSIPWLITLVIVFAYTDLVAASLIKPWAERIRPCNDLDSVRLLVNCGGGYSFPSAHAANHFGLSFFILYSLREYLSNGARTLLILWAVCVAYAQVYVGVHYPLDVMAGAFLGWGIAYIVARFLANSRSFGSL